MKAKILILISFLAVFVIAFSGCSTHKPKKSNYPTAKPY